MHPVDAILGMLDPRPVRPPIVLIDGFSGAGKTTLATSLVAEWTSRGGAPVQLLQLERVYPGWDGLAAAAEHVLKHVLGALRDGDPGRWRQWDWEADAPGAWNGVDGRLPLVIEGVGSLSGRSRALADLGVWIELDAASRKIRALARDGDTFAPHWERWARQERDFAQRERPREHADLILDGASLRAKNESG